MYKYIRSSDASYWHKQKPNWKPGEYTYTGKTWSEFIRTIDEESPYEVDSAYRRRATDPRYADDWIQLIGKDDGKIYDAEVTQYWDGSFELREYNIHPKSETVTSANMVRLGPKEVTSAILPDGTEYDPEQYAGGYTEWDEIISKRVPDSDGFLTDYTLWYNQFEDIYVCTFGDKDIYYPENSDWDFECETYDEAVEWYNDYTGFEDVLESKRIRSSFDLGKYDLDKVEEIADRYNTSSPVSGDWDTETVHEMRAIAEELNISIEEAKQIMIEYLGFDKDMVVSCDSLDSADIGVSRYKEGQDVEQMYANKTR